MNRKLAFGGGAIGTALVLAALAGTRSFSPTVKPPLSRRALVVKMAASQLGVQDPSLYWQDAYGSVPPTGYAWCGVFALWVLRRALGVTWKWVAGLGFIWVDDSGKRSSTPRLPTVRTPQPGDIAYFDQPYQHYAVVESVSGNTVTLIAGNTPDVNRYDEPLSKASAYYSIASLV